MSSIPAEIQRLALVGFRAEIESFQPAIESFLVKLQALRGRFSALPSAATVIAGLGSLIEEIDEALEIPSSSPPRRIAPRPPEPEQRAPAVTHRRRRRPPRKPVTRRPPPSKKVMRGAALSAAKRAWDVGRDTLAALAMSLDGLSIADAARLMSEEGKAIDEGTARWRLNARVRRHHARLVRQKPPLYAITDLGKEALRQDKDLEP